MRPLASAVAFALSLLAGSTAQAQYGRVVIIAPRSQSKSNNGWNRQVYPPLTSGPGRATTPSRWSPPYLAPTSATGAGTAATTFSPATPTFAAGASRAGTASTTTAPSRALTTGRPAGRSR